MWTKDRPYSPGELEFHLTGIRAAQGEGMEMRHDDEWARRRAEKLARRHREVTP